MTSTTKPTKAQRKSRAKAAADASTQAIEDRASRSKRNKPVRLMRTPIEEWTTPSFEPFFEYFTQERA